MQNATDFLAGGTMCLAKALLAEGTNAATIKTTNAIDYAIDGILYTKAATDNIAMNALAVQADLTTCLYLVQIDSAGAVTLKKGVEVLTADLTAGTKVLHYPEPDASKCPVGYIKVANSGGTFTSGTTDLGAGTVTDTYYDVVMKPTAPRTS